MSKFTKARINKLEDEFKNATWRSQKIHDKTKSRRYVKNKKKFQCECKSFRRGEEVMWE